MLKMMRSDQVAAIFVCSAVSTWSVRDDQNYSARCKAPGATGHRSIIRQPAVKRAHSRSPAPY